MGQIRIIIVDHTGAKITPVEVPDDVPMERLIPALVTKMSLPTVQGGSPIVHKLDHNRTGKRLSDDDTLSSAGVQPNDKLTLLPEVTAGGGIPIRSFRDIQLVEAIVNHGDLIQRMNREAILFAVFLYTDEDKQLASYIRNNIRELAEMSGHRCWYFTIEQPTPQWNNDIRRDLGALAGEYFDTLWERLGTETFKPFDKAQAYNIGQRFGVTQDQFPCIVFFSELKSKQIAVVEINKFVNWKENDLAPEYTRFFRVLFSLVQRVVSEPREKWLIQIGRLLPKEWKDTTHREVSPINPTELMVSFIEILGAISKTLA